MRKFVHISPYAFGDTGFYGGGERYPFELARAMSEIVPTEFVTFGKRAKSDLQGNLRVTVLPIRFRWKGSEFCPLSERLVSVTRRASVVHVHQWESVTTNVTVGLTKMLRRPLYVTDHGGYAQNYWRRFHLERWVAGSLPVSSFAASFLPALPVKDVLYGGVDTGIYQSDDEGSRPIDVLFVGRIMPHKGIDRLIMAVPPHRRLAIIGRVYDAVYRASLAGLAEGRNVTFREDASDSEVAEAYRRAKVAVLPSTTQPTSGPPAPKAELLGLALLEAMASGAAVVCTDVGGMPEIVSSGRTGFVVPDGDLEALRTAISELLADDTLRVKMAVNAREEVEHRFTWRAVAQRCLDVYGSTPRLSNAEAIASRSR